MSIQLQIFALLLVVNSTFSVFSGNCDVVTEPSNLTLYANWPVELDCEHLVKIWEKDNQAISEFTCEIWNGTNQVLPPIVEFTSARETHFFKVKLVVNGTSCISDNISVEVVPFPSITCEDFLQKSVDSAAVVDNEATIGNQATLSCQPSTDSGKIIPSTMRREDFETTWMINCEKDRDATYRQNAVIYNNASMETYPDDLVIASVDCVDAGQFVCSVTYNDRKLFVAAQSLCVKKNVDDEPPSLTCNSKELVARGATTHMDCVGFLPNGKTYSDEFAIKWSKDEQTVCSTSVFNQTSNSNGKVACLTKGNNDSLICVKDGRTPTEPCQSERKKIEVEMEIRNMGSFDYGFYEVVIEHKGRFSSSTVEVMEDFVPVYEKLVAILSVALVFVLSLVILTTLYNKYELYIKLQCIKLRGYYKQTGEWAFLSYFFERPDEGNEAGAFRDIEAIVSVVHATIDFYDTAIEANVQNRQGMFINTIERSHSAILILSSSYLDDEDTRFQAELAFNNLMTQRVRLIFILTGDVEKKLRKRPEEVWKKINIAVKVFGAFVWFDRGEGALEHYLKERMPPRLENEMELIMR